MYCRPTSTVLCHLSRDGRAQGALPISFPPTSVARCWWKGGWPRSFSLHRLGNPLTVGPTGSTGISPPFTRVAVALPWPVVDTGAFQTSGLGEATLHSSPPPPEVAPRSAAPPPHEPQRWLGHQLTPDQQRAVSAGRAGRGLGQELRGLRRRPRLARTRAPNLRGDDFASTHLRVAPHVFSPTPVHQGGGTPLHISTWHSGIPRCSPCWRWLCCHGAHTPRS